ncbi:MAG TPA: molybdopterin-dependent oxidoreductase [Clostridiales bacterium]|jgi:DMSO/TMAO reductase YedYZ molybdopterin-dependent catalytic subunit|nr:molybdopterin-dependent oxidoreductase [Clostridiales bacterium]
MKKKLTGFVCILFIAALVLSGCGAQVDSDAIAGYEAAEITISGLTEEDFKLSIGELAKLETVSRPATARRSNGEKVSINATGPLLDTFLAQYDMTQNDFASIRFAASDGYAITVDANLLANREIILALSDGGKALSMEDQPLRIVIPGERAMYWVRHLTSISFERETRAAACTKIMLLESAIPGLQAENYNYYGVTDRVVTLIGLLDMTLGESPADDEQLGFYAADGLNQTKTWVDIKQSLLKFTGADAPRLVGENLPEGMQFYDLVWLNCGEWRVLCLEKAVSLWGEAGRLGLYKLLNHLGGVSADKYVFSTIEGVAVTYSVDDLEQADLFIDEQGRVVLELADGSHVEALLKLEAAI